MKEKNEEISAWVEAYSTTLLRRALALVDNKDDAMDLVQEVFVSASLAYHSFQGKSAPLTWLQNILRNKISDFYRDHYRRPATVRMADFFDQRGSWVDQSVLNDWSVELDASDDKGALMDTMEQCLEHLPMQWRSIIKQYYLEDKKASAVCELTGITTANLWKILQRSRMQLRKCIETNYFDNL